MLCLWLLSFLWGKQVPFRRSRLSQQPFVALMWYLDLGSEFVAALCKAVYYDLSIVAQLGSVGCLSGDLVIHWPYSLIL